MKNSCLRVLYNHLYLIWGAVTVCVVGTLTGAVTASIIGVAAGVSVVTLVDRVMR